MALLDTIPTSPLTLILLTLALATLGAAYLFQKPKLPAKAPPLTSDTFPVLGALHFFSRRWDFLRNSIARSRTGNFSFYAGQFPVVAVAGAQGRKTFFEEKRLGFAEGYAALLGGSPKVQSKDSVPENAHGGDAEFSGYFNKRMVAIVRPARLAKNLPWLLSDAREAFEGFAKEGRMDVFESVYRLVFKFTMRTVACNEIAESDVLLDRTMQLFEDLDSTATALAISFPWMPLPEKVKRFYIGARLYKVFNDVIKERQKTGRRDDDPLQYLLDEGDQTIDILTFVLGALFAGQLNSGINTAYLILHLAAYPAWQSRLRAELRAVLDRHIPDPSLPLADRVTQLPYEAWENDFPLADICLKETIRMHMVGAAFRQNTSAQDIPIDPEGREVIPAGAYATFALGDVHYDPNIYPDPDEWDPSRFERGEDAKENYAYVGWGVARHPCLGMRFAKIENNILMAFFLAYFENLRLEDRSGKPVSRIPPVDRNGVSAHKPRERVFLRWDVRS